MSWKEEERNKIVATNEVSAKASAILKDKNRIKAEKVLQFWNKLVRANLDLYPEIRLNSSESNRKLGDIYTGELYLNGTYINKGFLYITHNIKEDRLVMIDTEEAKAFWGFAHRRYFYHLSDEDIEILLRNMVQKRRITDGLTPYKIEKVHEASRWVKRGYEDVARSLEAD